MTKYILPFLALLITQFALAQNTFKATIKDIENSEPLIGATAILKGSTNGAVADANGNITINNIADGNQIITFNFIGYESKTDTFNFPLKEDKPIIIFLKTNGTELEEVIVSTTRTSRTIQNVPTRVETIELEEIEEKSNMRPANVSMILHESTGIQVQQTSATSANASVRIQGLDGRYTQLLKDGYPNFGNFASGLSLLEIPPLDLQQVEIIKGPASTLFGAGAIAGVVNFISKTPKEKVENNFIINQSNIGQTNIGAYSSERKRKFGYSFLALGNLQKGYDVDKDDFTELPKSEDFTIHPKLFFYPNLKNTIMIGNSYSKGIRAGGDINVINNKADTYHTYFEKNNTIRNTSTIEFDHYFKGKNHIKARSSYSYFKRQIAIPNYEFKGANNNSFTDVSYIHNLQNQTIIIGANYISEKFLEKQVTLFPLRNFTTNTAGIYAQHTWDITENVKLESGLRTDVVNYFNTNYNNTETFLLPRISALFKLNEKFTSRIGGGLGYKTPSMFTEQTEGMQYKNILPLYNISSENSYGATADLSYKTIITEDVFFSINHMFFYTNIYNSTVLEQSYFVSDYSIGNTTKPLYSTGFETNAKLILYENIKFFVGYTFTYAKAKYLVGNKFLTLLPRNKLNLALVWEKENNFKIGLEGYFTDRQYLRNGTITKRFWEYGFMAQKTWGKISVYANAENFTDVRQSRYKRVVNEPHSNPTFDDIWTHTEGLVLSCGVKIKL